MPPHSSHGKVGKRPYWKASVGSVTLIGLAFATYYIISSVAHLSCDRCHRADCSAQLEDVRKQHEALKEDIRLLKEQLLDAEHTISAYTKDLTLPQRGERGRLESLTESQKDHGAAVALCESNALEMQANSLGTSKPDSWSLIKWTGMPDTCTVKGHQIEQLDADFNFRRGYSLRLTQDVEDKTHLLPWLLASRDGGQLASRKRRVLLDLGANSFNTSTLWFLRWYPLEFTEIHAYEQVAGLFRKPRARSTKGVSLGELDKGSRMKGVAAGGPPLPAWLLRRITLHQAFVGTKDNPWTKTVDIMRVIKKELQLTRDDTVIVKMDIEGEEWNILPKWLEDDDMLGIVDELFVEVHYTHPSMEQHHWLRFKHSREQAAELLLRMRRKGFYVHAWP
eukprot:jgi/Mesen1/1741/ME001390S00744